jgi:hypothetical protein
VNRFVISGGMTLQFEGTVPAPGPCVVGFNSPTGKGDGVRGQLDGTATGTVFMDQCVVRGNHATGVRAIAAGASNLTVAVSNGFVSSQGGQQGVAASNQDDADITVSVTNIEYSGFPGPSIRVGQEAGNASTLSMLRATISANDITSASGTLGTRLPSRSTARPGRFPRPGC